MADNKFKIGNTPHNKGKKASEYLSIETIEKIAQTQFTTDQNTGEKHPCWKGGIQNPTKDCVLIWDGNGKRKRRPKAIYEENFGPVPKGHVIYHLDGIKKNDHPDNLIAITRGELLRLNKENAIKEL